MLIKNKAVRDFISRCITGGFSGLNRLFPKNQHQILFYTNTGIKDNLKVMMDTIAEKGFSDYKLLCSCNDTAGLPAAIKPISNPAGLFAFLRSGYVFYFNGKIPVKPSRSQTVVNLWHGIPLKKIGKMLYPEMDLDFSTHYLAPSVYSGKLMEEVFGCHSDKILINGLPRCDRLFEGEDAVKTCALLGRPNCTRLIGWMPTFRSSDVSEICDSDLKERSASGLPVLHTRDDLIRCNNILAEHHTLLWVKLHPSENNFPDNGVFSNILIQSDREFRKLNMDFYRLLGSCEALITDYSSVYFDYLLLDRPILFAIEDIDTYAENRGFTAKDPISQMPGNILQHQEVFYQSLTELLTGQADRYQEKRKKIREKYCGETDRHAAESLLQKINLKGA